MVAVLFTSILMAGMARVFKTSLTTFYTSSEKISNLRRNRVAMDLVYDDLNSAGMSLVNLSKALDASDTNPAFYIIPNVKVTGAAGDDPTITDQLYMAYDQPLPFEGTLTKGGGALNGSTVTGNYAGAAVAAGVAEAAADLSYEIDCLDANYAKLVKKGMRFHIKDSLEGPPLEVDTATPTGSTSVTVTVNATLSETTAVTGIGDSGTLRTQPRHAKSTVLFFQPRQMVRYQVSIVTLDPANPHGVPCLVREQGTYDLSTAFTPIAGLTQIVAEHVSGFKVYLSANAGTSWAGSTLGTSVLDFDNGWTKGIQKDLNDQLSSVNRVDYTTTAGNLAWYRDIPVLVRLDITTRTPGQRTEYSSTGQDLAHKQVTQSVVLVPRHFGLPLS
jgi:hypothetical protein